MIDIEDILAMEEDMPISEELLGQYLEGSLSPEDKLLVEEIMESNPMVQEFMDFTKVSRDLYLETSGEMEGDYLSLSDLQNIKLPDIDAILQSQDFDGLEDQISSTHIEFEESPHIDTEHDEIELNDSIGRDYGDEYDSSFLKEDDGINDNSSYIDGINSF